MCISRAWGEPTDKKFSCFLHCKSQIREMIRFSTCKSRRRVGAQVQVHAFLNNALDIYNLWNENQLMSLFYSYIAGSLHVSGPQAHLQESSYSCSHNHWFSISPLWTRVLCVVACLGDYSLNKTGHNTQSTRPERYRYWTNGCVNSCTNSPEDGPVGPKYVETQQYTNKVVTSVGFHSIRWKDARYKKLKICNLFVPRSCHFTSRERDGRMHSPGGWLGLRMGLGTLETGNLLVLPEIKTRFLKYPYLLVAAQETSAVARESRKQSLLQHVQQVILKQHTF